MSSTFIRGNRVIKHEALVDFCKQYKVRTVVQISAMEIAAPTTEIAQFAQDNRQGKQLSYFRQRAQAELKLKCSEK